MENLLAFLHDFGSVSWVNLWMPLGIWTLIAAFSMVLLRTITLHPTLHYYLRFALILSLPIGIIFMNLTWLTPQIEPQSVFYPIVILSADVASIAVTTTTESVSITAMHWVGGLNVVLLVVGFVSVLRHIYQHFLLTRHFTVLKSASDEISGLAQTVAQKCGLRKQVQVFISDKGDIPYTYGLRKPVIVLPSEQFSTEKLESILTHEIMHIRRSDFAIQWTEQFIRAVFLFHPLVHLLVRDLQKYREMSCDADVISGMYVNPRLYASLLLDFVSCKRKPALSVMISMATPTSKIKERITNMQNYPKSPKSGRNIRLMSILSGIALFLTAAGIVACSDVNRSSAEVELDTDVNTEVFKVVEEMPVPTEGLNAISEIVYPPIALKAGIEGTVLVQYVVNEVGRVVNPVVLRGIGAGCDEAVVDAISKLTFTPGKQRGQAVSVQLLMPVEFSITDGEGFVGPPRKPANTQGDSDVFMIVEKMPEPIGGMAAIFNNVRYPQEARDAGISGRVTMQFIIDENGNIIDPHVVQSPGHLLSEAALKALEGIKFTPGMQRGKAVKVQFQLPIVFSLDRGNAPPPPTESEIDLNSPTSSAPPPPPNRVSLSDYGTERFKSVTEVIVGNEISLPSSSQAAEFSGIVRSKDPDVALVGANIMVTKKGDSRTFGTVTDLEGRFLVTGLEDGEYEFSVSYIGYSSPKLGLRVKRGTGYSAEFGLVQKIYEIE